MDKVEKVARAIYEARGAHEPPRAWRKWEDIGDEARAVWCQCATSALAAMGEREAASHPLNTSAVVSHEPGPVRDKPEPVAWVLPGDDNARADGFLDAMAWKGGEFTKPLYASPRPEAVEEAVKAGDWRAVDDAIWFFLGHENHKPEDSARLRRMSGVVLGLAGYAKR